MWEPSGSPTAGTAFLGWRNARAAWTGAFDRRRAAWRHSDSARHETTSRGLAEAQARLDEAAAEIERVAPGTTRRPTLPQSPPVEQVGAVLAADTVLVEFVLGDRELLVFTVTATACHGRRAEVDVRALLATIGRLHARWSTGRPDGRLERVPRIMERDPVARS